LKAIIKAIEKQAKVNRINEEQNLN